MSKRSPILLVIVALAVMSTARAAAPPTLTGFDRYGDPLPRGAAARLGTVRLRHNLASGSGHAQLLFSPDGRVMFSRSDSGLRLWDVETGAALSVMPAVPGARAVRLIGDGKTLVTVKQERPAARPFPPIWVAERWRWRSGEVQSRVEMSPDDDNFRGLGLLSLDAKVFASFDYNHEPILWDTQTGKKLCQLGRNVSVPGNLVFTTDGKRIVALSGNEVSVYETATGRQVSKWTVAPKWTLPTFFSYAFPEVSPDGRFLVLSASDLLLYDLQTSRQLARHEGLQGPACFSPDGKRLACSGTREIHLLDARTLKPIRKFEPHHEISGTHPISFLPGGKRLALGSEHSISLWDVETGKRLLAPNAHLSAVHRLAFSPDSRYLASGGQDGTAHVWELATSKVVHAFPGHDFAPVGLAFSPDGRLLATGDGVPYWSGDNREAQVRLFDLTSGRLLRQFPAHLGGVQSLCFSPDGKRLATGGGDDRVRLWDTSGTRLGQVRHLMQGKPVSFLAGGKFLLAHEGNGPWHVIDSATSRTLRSFGEAISERSPNHTPVALEKEGLIAVVEDRHVVWYRLADGKQERWSPIGRERHDFGIVALSADGRLGARITNTHSIELRDLVTDQRIATLVGHPEHVPTLAFSPDGRWLASGSYDTTVLLWDLERLRLEYVLAEVFAGRGDLRQLATLPGKGIQILTIRLKQTAESERRTTRLIKDLDDDSFEVREKATKELKNLGLDAVFGLRQALETGSEEVKSRARRLLGRIAAKDLKMVLDAAQVRQILARLAKLKLSEARQAVAELAGLGNDTLVGREARRVKGEVNR